jgi:hypothetical protein
MSDKSIAGIILILSAVFLLPCVLAATKPPTPDEPQEPETIVVEVHFEKRVVHYHTGEFPKEIVEREEEILEQTRPIPNVMEEPLPEWNGDLRKLRITCYLPTGGNCADGTPPYFGAVASNHANMGRNMTLYRADLTEVGEFTVHDVGGHIDLQNGSALDIFTPDIDSAWAFLYENCWVENGQWYAWVKWHE